MNSTAAFSTSSLAAGTHYIIASYNGDANFVSASSSYIPQVVNKIGTSVSIYSTQNPTIPNQNIYFMTQVTPATSAASGPSGTVQLVDGGAVMATATLSNGAGQFQISFPAVGSHSLTAVYSGDATFAGGTSAVLNQSVKNISTPVLTSGTNPVTAGSTFTFTAVILQSTATGTVQFREYPASGNPITLGSATLVNARATFSISNLSVGTHNINAAYSGDANFVDSGSSLLPEVVRAATTTTVSAPSGSSTYGQSVTFTASVSPAGATGTVQFLDGATSLGTAPLNNGTASVTVSTLTAGTHSITAVYGGDSGNAGSTSGAWPQRVAQATATATASLASSQNPISGTQAFTLTATVSPNTATGTVQFLDGTALLSTVTVSNGTAALNPSLGAASHSLTAVCSGDTNYAGATSSVLSQLVTTTTTTSLSATPATSSYGQAVRLSAAVAPAPASGSIQFFDGGTSLGAVAVSAGAASLTISSLLPGTHTLTAVYSGDGAAYLASTSVALP